MSVCDRGTRASRFRAAPGSVDVTLTGTSAEGGDEAGVLIGNHQLHTAEPTRLQRAQELAPEHFFVGVADVAAQDLAGAVGGDAGGDDDGH
jgi:hypothetical protein